MYIYIHMCILCFYKQMHRHACIHLHTHANMRRENIKLTCIHAHSHLNMCQYRYHTNCMQSYFHAKTCLTIRFLEQKTQCFNIHIYLVDEMLN